MKLNDWILSNDYNYRNERSFLNYKTFQYVKKNNSIKLNKNKTIFDIENATINETLNASFKHLFEDSVEDFEFILDNIEDLEEQSIIYFKLLLKCYKNLLKEV